jgi:hypothetical protein
MHQHGVTSVVQRAEEIRSPGYPHHLSPDKMLLPPFQNPNHVSFLAGPIPAIIFAEAPHATLQSPLN